MSGQRDDSEGIAITVTINSDNVKERVLTDTTESRRGAIGLSIFFGSCQSFANCLNPTRS